MHGGRISIETYSAGADRDVASMVDNEHLKCTATLPLYKDEFFRAFAILILWKEIKNFEFLCCSTHGDLSIDVSITNVGLILTKLGWFLFSGYGQTDTVLETQLKAQN